MTNNKVSRDNLRNNNNTMNSTDVSIITNNKNQSDIFKETKKMLYIK